MTKKKTINTTFLHLKNYEVAERWVDKSTYLTVGIVTFSMAILKPKLSANGCPFLEYNALFVKCIVRPILVVKLT